MSTQAPQSTHFPPLLRVRAPGPAHGRRACASACGQAEPGGTPPTRQPPGILDDWRPNLSHLNTHFGENIADASVNAGAYASLRLRRVALNSCSYKPSGCRLPMSENAGRWWGVYSLRGSLRLREAQAYPAGAGGARRRSQIVVRTSQMIDVQASSMIRTAAGMRFFWLCEMVLVGKIVSKEYGLRKMLSWL